MKKKIKTIKEKHIMKYLETINKNETLKLKRRKLHGTDQESDSISFLKNITQFQNIMEQFFDNSQRKLLPTRILSLEKNETVVCWEGDTGGKMRTLRSGLSMRDTCIGFRGECV